MKKLSYKAVIFDFDGILVDSEPTHHKALIQVLAPFHSAFSFDEYKKTVLGLSDREAIEKLLPKLSQDQRDLLVQKKAEIFAQIAPQLTALQPGVLNLMEDLKKGGIRMGIASGALRMDIDVVLKAKGGEAFLKNFETIASADEVTHSKPDPETYLLACRRMKLDPKDCVSFEDTIHGLQAAKAAGLLAIGIPHTVEAALLTPYADCVVPGFQGLSAQKLEGLWVGRLSRI